MHHEVVAHRSIVVRIVPLLVLKFLAKFRTKKKLNASQKNMSAKHQKPSLLFVRLAEQK